MYICIYKIEKKLENETKNDYFLLLLLFFLLKINKLMNNFAAVDINLFDF